MVMLHAGHGWRGLGVHTTRQHRGTDKQEMGLSHSPIILVPSMGEGMIRKAEIFARRNARHGFSRAAQNRIQRGLQVLPAN
jgi:hypothetical protein